MKQLTIWHTNDIHSHLDNWPRISSFLKANKERAKETGENVLFFDIGDFLDRVHPLTEGTSGKANVELLNELPFDAVTIGNNEGTTLPHQALETLYDQAKFPVVCANIYGNPERTKRTDWAVPVVYKYEAGLKIAVLGATAAFREYYESLGWGIEEPIQALKRELAELNSDTDLVILLSHLGLQFDEQIATELPEIDIVLGGHTHHLLETGKQVGETLLAAAGRWGEYVGEVTLTWNDAGELRKKEARVHETAKLVPPKDEAEQIQGFFQKGKEELSEVIVHLPEKLETNWFGDSSIAEIIYAAATEWAEGEAFLTNAGIFMTDIGPGDVTAFDVHQLLPHPLNLIAVTLSGSELEVLIQEILRKRDELKDLPLRGFGFRGEVFGSVLMKRAGFDAIRGIPLWDGEPISTFRKYRIVTHDTFVFAPFFPIIKQSSEKEVYTPELLRDIFAWKLKQLYGEEKE